MIRQKVHWLVKIGALDVNVWIIIVENLTVDTLSEILFIDWYIYEI